MLACYLGLAPVLLPTYATVAHGHDEQSIARGQALAARWCTGCHSPDGTTVVERIVVPSLAAAVNRPNRSSERLQAFLLTPHRPMPAIPLELGEIKDIAAYLGSLKQ